MLPPHPPLDPLLGETLDPATGRLPARPTRHAALSVLWHPDPRRIGERARLPTLASGGQAVVSRLEPCLSSPDASTGGPIADPYVSRSGVTLRGAADGSVTLVAAPAVDVRVDGATLERDVVLDSATLERGVVLTLAGRVVLLLHRLGPPAIPGDALGLIGASEAMDELRAELLRAAPLDASVLLTGPSGSGKELVAAALHARSARAAGPFVAVNVAAINPSTAASELFGHARGAFTGAATARAGLFAEASGGTLFLDEVGEASPELQGMLLRTLETGRVLPVGASAPSRVDVRVLAATDADLDALVRGGRFRLALVHRLAGYRIAVPPLAARRDDLGRLLRAFLEADLTASGDLAALWPLDPRTPSWLPAELAERLFLHPWPGNVRELRNAARQLAAASHGAPQARLSAALEAALVLPSGAPPPSPAEPEGQAERSDDAIIAALERHRWAVHPAARELGMSKTTLYKRIDASPVLRKAADVPEAELRAAFTAAGGALAATSAALRVSPAGLRRRLGELGLRPR